MYRRIPVFAAVIVSGALGWIARDASGQTAGPPTLVGTRASMGSGHVQGVVLDDLGGTVGGASVLAMGETIASVRSDAKGRFSMALAPGEYILRATRSGYISTARVPVRVQTAVLLERNIMLMRQDAVVSVATLDDSHAHTDLAWRLRHLTRSVLRDESGGVPTDAPASGSQDTLSNGAIGRSTQVATSYFTETDFNGQVNVLATGFTAGAARWLPSNWPRSVAYVAFGAPVGGIGDWNVRGALASGPGASWVLVGEYGSRDDAAHAFKLGMSYGSQAYQAADSSALWTAGMTYARSVSGIYGTDRWTISPALRLDYGLRFDRYDYIETPQVMSGHGRLRARVMAGTYVLAGASRSVVAPGADEFLPPITGPWVPPERTFSALGRGTPLRAEDVRRFDAGLARDFHAGGRAATIDVRRFRETSTTQMVTLFGLDDTRGRGHYVVTSPGDVDVSGWVVGIQGRLAEHVNSRLEYTVADAVWTRRSEVTAVDLLAASAVRPPQERLHDLTASVDATVSETATRITVVVRTDSALLGNPGHSAGGRFDLRVRQALPFQPLGREPLELVFDARTLFRDTRQAGAFYDELLAISPPLRLMAGVQVRF